MPNSPPAPAPGPRAAPTSARRQLTWCRYPMHEFTLRFRPRTPPPSPGFRALPAGFSFSLCCCCCGSGGGARLSGNSSEAEWAGDGAGLPAGRRIYQTGLDRRELLREHGALLTFRAGARGFDDPDTPPPADRLREKGQMLMFNSEPAPPPVPACAAACFRPLAPSLTRFSFSSAGFLEKMSVQRFDPPPPPPLAAAGCWQAMEAGGATEARREPDTSPGSGSRSGSGSGKGTPWLMLPPAWDWECDDAGFGGRTGSGRSTPPAKSSSAQEGDAAGLAWSGQNSNSGEEDALLLLLSSAAASIAPPPIFASAVKFWK